MPKLRELLEDAGFDDVQTYVQSGNVVLSTSKNAKQTARAVEKVIKHHFRIDVPVVVRTRGELAAVVKANPLKSVAKDPKRYQVTFFETAPDSKLIRRARRAGRGRRAAGPVRPRDLRVASSRHRPFEDVERIGESSGYVTELDNGDEAARACRQLNDEFLRRARSYP